MYASFSPPSAFVPEPGAAGDVEYVPTGGQFWDGRADTLADQAKLPLLNPREMNNPSAAAVIEKIRIGPYARLFRAVYGDDALDDSTPPTTAWPGRRWYPRAKFDDLPPEHRDDVNQDEVPYDRHPGEAPRLTDDEIDLIVAFLGTLTDRTPALHGRR